MGTFPLDIVEEIVDHLALDDPNLSSTKACSLASRDFHAICRQRIFACIILNDPDGLLPHPNFDWEQRGNTSDFQRLLSENPDLGRYIRNLQFRATLDDLENGALIETIQKITRLRALNVSFASGVRTRWIDQTHIRPCLLHLLQLPTLVAFHLFHVNDFLLNDLTSCSNLQRLQLRGVTTLTESPSDFHNSLTQLRNMWIGPSFSTTLAEICAAQCTNGMPFVDFRNLQQIDIAIASFASFGALSNLFHRCSELVDVFILFNRLGSDFWELTGLTSMLALSMKSLKRLHISTTSDSSRDFLCGLVTEFEKMSNNNVIETICISLSLYHDQYCTKSNAWGRLDKVLAGSGWASLFQVSIAITFFSSEGGSNDLRKTLETLPEMWLSRLSSSNILLFQVIELND